MHPTSRPGGLRAHPMPAGLTRVECRPAERLWLPSRALPPEGDDSGHSGFSRAVRPQEGKLRHRWQRSWPRASTGQWSWGHPRPPQLGPVESMVWLWVMPVPLEEALTAVAGPAAPWEAASEARLGLREGRSGVPHPALTSPARAHSRSPGAGRAMRQAGAPQASQSRKEAPRQAVRGQGGPCGHGAWGWGWAEARGRCVGGGCHAGCLGARPAWDASSLQPPPSCGHPSSVGEARNRIGLKKGGPPTASGRKRGAWCQSGKRTSRRSPPPWALGVTAAARSQPGSECVQSAERACLCVCLCVSV